MLCGQVERRRRGAVWSGSLCCGMVAFGEEEPDGLGESVMRGEFGAETLSVDEYGLLHVCWDSWVIMGEWKSVSDEHQVGLGRDKDGLGSLSGAKGKIIS